MATESQRESLLQCLSEIYIPTFRNEPYFSLWLQIERPEVTNNTFRNLSLAYWMMLSMISARSLMLKSLRFSRAPLTVLTMIDSGMVFAGTWLLNETFRTVYPPYD